MFTEKLNELLLSRELSKDTLKTLKRINSFVVGTTKTFPLEKIFLLNDEHFEIALGALNESIFKMRYGNETTLNNFIFETNQNLFCNQTTFAEICSKHGLPYDTRYINTYYKRGKIPSEDLLIGGKPYWKESTILNFVQNKNQKT